MPAQRFVRILTTVYPPDPNGIGTYVDQVARELARMGHAVEVCVFCQERVRLQSAPGVAVRHLSRGEFRLERLPALALQVLGTQALHPADLVLAGDYRCLVAASLLPRSVRKITIIHGTEVLGRLLQGLNRLGLYRPLARFDRVVANSEFTRSLIRTHHGYLPREQVQVAPLGVDETRFLRASPSDLDRTREALSLDPRRTLLLSVGRIEPRKGQVQVVEAVSALPRELRDRVTCLLVGGVTDDAYAAQVDAAIAGASADIRRTGPVSPEHLQGLYGLAWALIHAAVPEPRAVEGFGLVLLEAAAQGLPVISTRTDAIPEVVAEGRSGLLVPPRDGPALTSAIARLVSDPALRERLAHDSVLHARTFPWRRHVEQLLGPEG